MHTQIITLVLATLLQPNGAAHDENAFSSDHGRRHVLGLHAFEDDSNPHRIEINRLLKVAKERKDLKTCGVERLSGALGDSNRDTWDAQASIAWTQIEETIKSNIDEGTKMQLKISSDLEAVNKDLAKVPTSVATVDDATILKAIKDVVTDETCWEDFCCEDPHPARAAMDQLSEKLVVLMKANKVVDADKFLELFRSVRNPGTDVDWDGSYCETVSVSVAATIRSNTPRMPSADRVLKLENKRDELNNRLVEMQAELEECVQYERNLAAFKEQMHSLHAERDNRFFDTQMAGKKVSKSTQLLDKVTEGIQTQVSSLEQLKAVLDGQGGQIASLNGKVQDVTKKYTVMDATTQAAKQTLDKLDVALKKSSAAADASNKFKEMLIKFVQDMNIVYDQVIRNPLKLLGLKLETEESMKKYFPLVEENTVFQTSQGSLANLNAYCETTGIPALAAVEGVAIKGQKPTAICQNAELQNPERTMADLAKTLVQSRDTTLKYLKGLMGVLDADSNAAKEQERQASGEPEGVRRFNSFYSQSTFYNKYLKGWMVLSRGAGGPQALLLLWLAIKDSKADFEKAQKLANADHEELTAGLAAVVQEQRNLEDQLRDQVAKKAKTGQDMSAVQGQLDKLQTERARFTEMKSAAETALNSANDALRLAQEAIVNTHAEIHAALLEMEADGVDFGESVGIERVRFGL